LLKKCQNSSNQKKGSKDTMTTIGNKVQVQTKIPILIGQEGQPNPDDARKKLFKNAQGIFES
jgi:hypothetical protein